MAVDKSKEKRSWVSRLANTLTGTALATGGALAAGAAAHWIFGLSADDLTNLLKDNDLISQKAVADLGSNLDPHSVLVKVDNTFITIPGSDGHPPTAQAIIDEIRNKGFGNIVKEFITPIAAQPISTGDALAAIDKIDGVNVLNISSLPGNLSLETVGGSHPAAYIIDNAKVQEHINQQIAAVNLDTVANSEAVDAQLDKYQALQNATGSERVQALLNDTTLKQYVTEVGSPGEKINVVQFGEKLIGVSDSNLTSTLQGHNQNGQFNDVLAKLHPEPAAPAPTKEVLLAKLDGMSNVATGTLQNPPENTVIRPLAPAVAGGPEKYVALDVAKLDKLAADNPAGTFTENVGDKARALAYDSQAVRPIDVIAGVAGGGATVLGVRGMRQEAQRRADAEAQKDPNFWRGQIAEGIAARDSGLRPRGA